MDTRAGDGGRKRRLYLKDTFDDTTILGWMIQTEDTEYSLPQPEIAGELLKISGARLENKGQFDGKWLDEKIRCKTPMYRPTVR